MQDGASASENVTLLTKSYDRLYKNTDALITIFVTLYVYHGSLLRGDSNPLCVSGQSLDSSQVSLTNKQHQQQKKKKKKQSFEKIYKPFLGKSLNLSFSYYHYYLFYLTLLLDTYQFEFTFLLLGLYKVDNNLQDVESSSDCNGKTGAYFCSR